MTEAEEKDLAERGISSRPGSKISLPFVITGCGRRWGDRGYRIGGMVDGRDIHV